MIELYLLIGFMIIGAIVAVEVRSLLSAVVSLGIVGFALCMAFLTLKAADVAITQLIVEVIVLVLLVRATGVRRDDTEALPGGRRELFAFVSVIIFMLIFAAFGLYALQYIPKFGQPLMSVSQVYLREAFAKTNAANLVASISLDFRAIDTLGEAAILFTAVLGAIALLRQKGRKKINERDD